MRLFKKCGRTALGTKENYSYACAGTSGGSPEAAWIRPLLLVLVSSAHASNAMHGVPGENVKDFFIYIGPTNRGWIPSSLEG